MSEQRAMAAERRVGEDADPEEAAAQRRLRDLRYLIAAIDAEAIEAWSSLWRELPEVDSEGDPAGSSPGGAFEPPGGWPKFVERFWLLKHYLDSIHRLCR